MSSDLGRNWVIRTELLKAVSDGFLVRVWPGPHKHGEPKDFLISYTLAKASSPYLLVGDEPLDLKACCLACIDFDSGVIP